VVHADRPSASAEAPKKAEQMLADARVLLNRGDDEGALSKVEQAAKLAPQWPAPHASLGLLYQRQSNEPLAREHLTRYQLLSLLESGAEDCRLTREIAEGEALMIYLTNQERARRGLPLLMPHAKLSRVARGHSDEMATLEYFSHRSPKSARRTPTDRFRQLFGSNPPCIAENLSRMSSRPLWSFNLDNLRDSHARLMDSDGHREAILWDEPTHIGVGIAVNERGDYWITENFVRFER
jgi:uncharacterized protein YkwD